MSCTFQEDVHDERPKLEALKKGIFITFAYFAVELTTSYLTHSLAMMGDSVHMFADGVAMFLMLKAYKMRDISPRNSIVGYLSFGFRRLELLVIILNTTLVGMAIVWITKEAYSRLIYGSIEVFAWPVLFVGIVGFIVNMTIFRTLSIHGHKEEGIKSIVACALTDALSPIAVIVGSLGMLISQRLFWLDTLAALTIAIMLVWSFWEIPRAVLNILMEAVPSDIDFEKVSSSIKMVYGVDNLLDLHINKVGLGLIVLTCRVSIKNHALHDFIPGLIEAELQEEFPELKNVHLTIETRCQANP